MAGFRLGLGVETEFRFCFQLFVCFLQICENRSLTCFGVWDYKPLTNEGGGAAGDDVLRSREIIKN